MYGDENIPYKCTHSSKQKQHFYISSIVFLTNFTSSFLYIHSIFSLSSVTKYLVYFSCYDFFSIWLQCTGITKSSSAHTWSILLLSIQQCYIITNLTSSFRNPVHSQPFSSVFCYQIFGSLDIGLSKCSISFHNKLIWIALTKNVQAAAQMWGLYSNSSGSG